MEKRGQKRGKGGQEEESTRTRPQVRKEKKKLTVKETGPLSTISVELLLPHEG